MSDKDPPGADPADGSIFDAGDLVRVQLQEHGDVTIVTVAGEIDVSNVERVRGVARQISDHAAGVVLDLSGLEYIDSTGISMLYDLAGGLRRHRQPLALVCLPDAQPRRVLELTGLTGEVAVRDDRTAAIAAVTRS